MEQPIYNVGGGASVLRTNVVPYGAGYQVVPYQDNAVVVPQPALIPKQTWLYSQEINPHTDEIAPVRKTIYHGKLWKPMVDEAYFAAHLAHQTAVSSQVTPGEVLQFHSSSNRLRTLTVVQVATETPDIGWRVLTDGRTNYLVFRGPGDWLYALYDSKLAVLHDVAPQKTHIKVHSLLLHQLIPHMPNIIASLRATATSRRVVICGHGNGGAYATICFLLLQRAGFAGHQMVVYTYGSPTVTTANLGLNRPLPHQISKAIFNFVNEDDVVPSILGNKDTSSLTQLVSSMPDRENPLLTNVHSPFDLKSYQPVGRYFHLGANNVMTDIEEGREKFFLNILRSHASLPIRLSQNRPEIYVDRLRQVVCDN